MGEQLNDFVHGPLDMYRDKATFDWRKLKVYLEGEDILKYKQDIYSKLQNEDCFKPTCGPQTFEEIRYQTFLQAKAYKSFKSVTEHINESTKEELATTRILTQLAPSSIPKQSVIFLNHLKKLGTHRHRQFMEDVYKNKVTGCFCLTEIGHGSNLKGFGTRAVYSKEKKVFTINTPNFESAKCWAGCLGQTATHAVVFANLEIDDKQYGLQSFIVPIRDVNTLLPFAGIIVGDMGEKTGLNGVDNGFILFKNYEIPRENLLDKLCDVTEDGLFILKVKDLESHKEKSRIALSIARISTVARNECLGTKGLVVAVRYAAVRKQFGPGDGPEVCLLEYQTHQYRLFPYLAAAIVFKNTWMYLADVQDNLDFYSKNRICNVSLASELHAIACGAKAISGWTMRDVIQGCREACGGHGYLKVSGFDDTRSAQDAVLTYDGENYVLLQQTSNILIKLWPLIVRNQKISSPLESFDFLSNGDNLLREGRFTIKTVKELFNQTYILYIYDWLVVYLIKSSAEKLENQNKQSEFWVQSDNQIFYAKDLAVTYIERLFLLKMLNLINNAPDKKIQEALTDMFFLYALWNIRNHMPVLYQGGFASNRLISMLVKEGILKLLGRIKNNAIALVDAIAPPDFLLNSVLGYSDGQVYKHLESAFLRFPNGLSRPTWWKEVLDSEQIPSKL
ncbi:unnamed protein product [Brassicogethes aeneus]|uniref:Acyl-coenzyme A oxidase n=1 Tax=Brassicogethes aeneus TaxID=1431903 RepID=A0A9P0FIK6_BRAAE|nr:unnamed protein product [Brassicogethes aeneus]